LTSWGKEEGEAGFYAKKVTHERIFTAEVKDKIWFERILLCLICQYVRERCETL